VVGTSGSGFASVRGRDFGVGLCFSSSEALQVRALPQFVVGTSGSGFASVRVRHFGVGLCFSSC
jgi:hypothetical protein